MSKIIELTGKSQNYNKVSSDSAHGKFSIEDDEDEDVELSFEQGNSPSNGRNGSNNSSYREAYSTSDKGPFLNAVYWTSELWSTLTFSWMQKLLQTGNERPLEMSDLYKLSYEDSAEGVYKKFKKGWLVQLAQHEEPSLTSAFFHAFGRPFMMAALLKFVHDSLLFVGPQLLNALINFLNDPSQPMSVGLWYVFGLFAAQLTMSLCLRQYFWYVQSYFILFYFILFYFILFYCSIDSFTL
jgi:hypothetical protein